MNQKRPEKAFTSFRLIGKRAQDLLTRARDEIRRAQRVEEKEVEIERDEECECLTVKLHAGSVVRATFAVLGVLVGTWFMVQISDVLLLFLLSAFVAVIIDPGVQGMERWGIPRGLGVLVHYVIVAVCLVFLLLSLIPIIADQIRQIWILISERVDMFLAHPQIAIPLFSAPLNDRLTLLMQSMLQDLSIHQFADALQNFALNLSTAAQGSIVFATRIAGGVVEFIVRMIVIMVLAFFIQMEKERIRVWFRSFFPKRLRFYMDHKADAIHHKIGQWARGQVILGLVIGILVFLALTVLGMHRYALTLAVLAGFTEFIPYVGPFIAAVPAILIAMTEGGFLWALIVTGVYYVVQWCENNLLVPLIMRRAVGLSPIAIILAMLVSVSFPDVIHPVLGILLAVPATTIVTLFLEDWRRIRVENDA